MKKAIIIGAGPAGLTAGYELLKNTNYKPIILEETNMIGGISKVLGIANQVIPIYLKAKPVIHNAKNILGVLKEMGKTIILT